MENQISVNPDQVRPLARQPLAVGNKYVYPGYENNGFIVRAMCFPNHPTDDGGLPGVSVEWLTREGSRFWYPFASETEFWNYLLFSNAIDA